MVSTAELAPVKRRRQQRRNVERDVRGCIVVLLFAVFVDRCFGWSLLGTVLWDGTLELERRPTIEGERRGRMSVYVRLRKEKEEEEAIDDRASSPNVDRNSDDIFHLRIYEITQL